MTPCEWCGRPGNVVAVAFDVRAERQFENPTLCEVCAALIELSGGGFDAVDDKRRWAQAQVHAELAENWRRRSAG